MASWSEGMFLIMTNQKNTRFAVPGQTPLTVAAQWNNHIE
jgi:hypothetical protein